MKAVRHTNRTVFQHPEKSALAGRILFVSNKGFAVNALAYGGIAFVGANLNLVQRTVVSGLYVILTFRNGAGNAVVCSFVFHSGVLRYFRFETKRFQQTVLPKKTQICIPQKLSKKNKIYY